MVILSLGIKNILGFEDLNLNFSYPKKLVNNTLGEEWLKDYPNFRYKKVNIFVGSNATGKSSIGKVLWGLHLFFTYKDSKYLSEYISYNSKSSEIKIEYACNVNDQVYLNKVIIYINAAKGIFGNKYKYSIDYSYSVLGKDDTYESAVKKYNFIGHFDNYLDGLEQINHVATWYISMPMTESEFDIFNPNFDSLEEKKEYCTVLKKIMKVLDPTICDVQVSNEADNGYVISFEDGKTTIIESGDKIQDLKYLSSGSKYGPAIAMMVNSIRKNAYKFYFSDELFSYINSEIECAILNVMISLLGDGEQLFFTTHNTDILDLQFPLHTFYFLRRITKENGKVKLEAVCASDFEKRNNVSVKNLYDNDVFGASPNLSLLYELVSNIQGNN